MTKEKAWKYALGIIQVDDLKPSDEFLKLVDKEIKGEISKKEILNYLDEKYKRLGSKA